MYDINKLTEVEKLRIKALQDAKAVRELNQDEKDELAVLEEKARK